MNLVFFRSAAIALAVASSIIGLAQAQEDLEGLEERALQAAVLRVAPSVVRLDTLGGLETVAGKMIGSGPTTGLIVSPDGFIISSAFNFVQQPSSILVTLPSGKRAAARIVARDYARSIVLLKADTDETLAVPEPAPRAELQVGQWTIAVGHTAGDVVNRSVGILSATNRIWGKAVQTDANVSPGNYGGPLIDIRGRVIGVLVPMSPQQQDELAGAEWYDSGIGFAVPLSDIFPHLEKMKAGTDLETGILGISLKGSDIYTMPATIAACPAKSPARKAGLQVGDTIVEVDSVPIQRQAQLRHILGPKIAGESVHVVVTRGEQKQRFEATIELAADVEPYLRPALGILPMRPDAMAAAEKEQGVVVRHVFANSAAAKSGLKPGDRIVRIDKVDVASASALSEQIAGHDPGDKVSVRFVRATKTLVAQATLGKSSVDVPDQLPPAHPKWTPPAVDLPPRGKVDVQIIEDSNQCMAYVPTSYNPQVTYGLLVWLNASGNLDEDAVVARWKSLCQQYDLILLCPQASDPQRWAPTETEFVRKTIDYAINNYAVDPTRVVLHGATAGGTMAYLAAFANRDVARAVASVNAPFPSQFGAPTSDPLERLDIYSLSYETFKAADRIKAGEERLQQLGFPVLAKTIPDPGGALDEKQLADLGRWIDALDRI